MLEFLDCRRIHGLKTKIKLQYQVDIIMNKLHMHLIKILYNYKC